MTDTVVDANAGSSYSEDQVYAENNDGDDTYISNNGTVFQIPRPKDTSARVYDYAGLFTDIFATFTTYHELVSVKTTNMGSLYKLTYEVGIADQADEKSMIDEIRCRNGNLEVALTRQETVRETL